MDEDVDPLNQTFWTVKSETYVDRDSNKVERLVSNYWRVEAVQ